MSTNESPLNWNMTDRAILVTGGGSGIGEAACKLLAHCGARVGVLGRDEQDVRRVVRECVDFTLAVPLIADVSQPDSMQAAMRTFVDRCGRLDGLFANAGINGTWAPLEELGLEEWNQTLAVNLTGAFLTLKFALPHLKRRGGSVVFNASINGTRVFSNTGATAYACSKAGLVALAKMTALELARHRVRVNVICPGAIDTPILNKAEERDLDEISVPVEFPAGSIPLTRGAPGRPDDVAHLALFLLSDLSRHVTGTEIWIDGGESLLAG